jgi:hypothetical protein
VKNGPPMNVLLTARQLDRLRELPPDHEVLTMRDGAPIPERPDGRLWRIRTAACHRCRLSSGCDPTCASASSVTTVGSRWGMAHRGSGI